MNFKETTLPGAFVVEPDKLTDKRGFFARTFCRKEFDNLGLDLDLVQCNISFNSKKGTLRGMHYQKSPHEEAKLVRCTQGAIYDVIVDLRKSSNSYLLHFGIELNAINRYALYVPKGFAHGFVTLTDATEVFYQMSEYYVTEASLGIRWDDPAICIKWPSVTKEIIISDRDTSYPDYKP